MKKLKSIVILLFITSSICFAQNTVEKIQPQDLVTEIGLENIASTLNVNPVQIQKTLSNSNNIYINQIGSNNTIKVKTATQHSAIDLAQEGNNNILKLNFSAMSATETIRQQGENHFISAYGNTPSLNLERTINQEGYGQNLTIHGNNSLSEKMQLNMKGSASTIIIRNFN